MNSKFTKATDSQHEIKLESSLISAFWRAGSAVMGGKASFEVLTSFVGNGASIKITGKSENGKKLGKVSGEIKNNKYIGEFEIPDDLKLDDFVYFEVDLSKNGLSGESNHIPVVAPIRVTNMKWSAKQARRGDLLTLSADVGGVRDDTEALITIYEYDRDGIHDKIVQLPAYITNQRLQVDWEYEYNEDTDEIPTEDELREYGRSYNPPEYFFVIEIEGSRFGQNQESQLLTFRDWIEVELKNHKDELVANAEYTLKLPDGSQKQGRLDGNGRARIEDVPPGSFRIIFPGLEE
jgi:hypothetical protein